jgi:hypothetical protein
LAAKAAAEHFLALGRKVEGWPMAEAEAFLTAATIAQLDQLALFFAQRPNAIDALDLIERHALRAIRDARATTPSTSGKAH